MLKKYSKNIIRFILILACMISFNSCKKKVIPVTHQPENIKPETLEYYKEQSVMTNPGKYVYLYKALPNDIPGLCKIVQGLLLHNLHTERYGVTLSDDREQELRLREVENILERIIELNDRPLIEMREPEKRVICHCRDYAVMLCSFLRYKSIPARVRSGFAAYFNEQLHQYHWICEYWDYQSSKWIQVDAQLDAVQIEHYKINFDPFNVPAGKFIYAGKEYHSADRDSNEFSWVKTTLIQDLAALNKMEVEVWDIADLMDTDKNQNSNAKKLLDRIAELTTLPDDNLPDLQSIYQDHSELQIHIH